jgi:uncharacterized protein YjbI with pentapeptide repeats
MANPHHVSLLVDAGKWRTYLGKGRELDLCGANLEGVNFRGRSLSDLNLSKANLRGADLRGSRLSHVDLTRTDLKGALLAASVWLEVDLVGADLSHADLSFSRVARSNLTDAKLVSSCLFGTILQQTVVINADFGEARSRRTVWSDMSLLQARNLDRVYHSSPSTLGLDTIIESHGQIPEVFLRGCGVPDEIIAYVRSLALSASPIQLYSCFISHSSKDTEFCQRLHNDLQAAGVRCWFAPEDLKIGDRFRDAIESAIRVHDKLLLVLSDNSVNSSWVRVEVESAVDREDRQGVQVLFPVRLDDAVMDASQAWAADIRRQRHIGDFSGWKHHDQYQRSFERLLRDLRAPQKPA